MDIRFLHDKEYYSEIYDRNRIEECWEFVRSIRKQFENLDQKLTVREQKSTVHIVLQHLKGEHWQRKAQAIQGMMERDRERDERLARAVCPSGLACLVCHVPLEAEWRDLLLNHKDGKEASVFFMRCPLCGVKSGYWESGEQWSIPNHCPQCCKEMEIQYAPHGEHQWIGTSTCASCGHIETKDIKFEPSPPPLNPEERKYFCFSDEEGQEYWDCVNQVQEVFRLAIKEGLHTDLPEKLAKIERLTVAAVESRLVPVMTTAQFDQLHFDKPDMGKMAIVSFSVRDMCLERSEYDSVAQLTKLIRQSLETTNWRLMSEGLAYRLGIVEGRLRGYEGDESLRELLRRESPYKKDGSMKEIIDDLLRQAQEKKE